MISHNGYIKILKNILETYQLKLNFVSSTRLKCGALIFKMNETYTVLCKNDLPENVKFFSILHEAGHVALNYFSTDPFKYWSAEVEKEINLWALDQIKPFISVEFYHETKCLFTRDEDLGYKNIEINLDKNFKGEI